MKCDQNVANRESKENENQLKRAKKIRRMNERANTEKANVNLTESREKKKKRKQKKKVREKKKGKTEERWKQEKKKRKKDRKKDKKIE